MRKRRLERFGQLTLVPDPPRDVDPPVKTGWPEEQDEPCIGTCGRCGAYWDMRQYETCPAPCGGYVG